MENYGLLLMAQVISRTDIYTVLIHVEILIDEQKTKRNEIGMYS